MQQARRTIIGLISVLTAAAMLPLKLFAGQWHEKAFDETRFADSLASVGITNPIESDQITLKTPEIAENGAIVPIEVSSEIPHTERIFVFAEKNPQPLVAIFSFVKNVAPFFATRIKMGESAKVHIVVLAEGKYYTTANEVKVTIGGCGE